MANEWIYKQENIGRLNNLVRVSSSCDDCRKSLWKTYETKDLYCSDCSDLRNLKKDNEEKTLRIQALEIENQTLKDKHDENIRDLLDKSQEWHQRVENDLKAQIIELKNKLNLEILPEDQLKEDEVECLTEQLFIS